MSTIDRQPDFEKIGRAAAALVLPSSAPSWIHRRVQSLRYVGSSWCEIRLSVDFDVPSAEHVRWVPITSLPKWPPLYRIDYTAGDNRPLPLLTSAQNGAADYGLMVALAEAIYPAWLENGEFLRALHSLTRGPETTLDESFEQLLDIVETTNSWTGPGVSRFIDLAASLIDSTLLWYPIERAAGAPRTLAKVAYHWPAENTDKFWVRALRSMSWWHPPEYLPLAHIGGQANFHLEIEAPAPLMVRSISNRCSGGSVQPTRTKPAPMRRTMPTS